MPLDRDACYRALLARDSRFDGVFFVAVKTTGIYCRPICPARPPRADRCVFFDHAVEAEREGFRACFRCRPERAPGKDVPSASRTVAAAALRIEAGALNDGDLEGLARELGVSARHLRRCTHAELGVSPIELALSRKLAVARELLHGTTLPITDIAFGSGFGSVRRFNDAFRARHGRSPTELRRKAARGSGARSAADGTAIRFELDYRPPYDWASMLAFLGARAVAGVEAVVDGAYVRSVRIGDRVGWISVKPSRARSLGLEVAPSLLPDLMPVVARVRRLFDLDARPAAIDAHLAGDPRLAALVGRRPGLRVPGAWSPFETAMAAVLGQQVTVQGGVKLASRLVEVLGTELETPFEGVHRVWPTAERVARARASVLAKLGMPDARRETLRLLAAAVIDGRVDFERGTSPAALEADLLSVPGVGPWTAQYILMRAAAWPDAFPGGDAALAKALGTRSPSQHETLAERWRPWRSYAALHLWTSLATTSASPTGALGATP